MGATSYGVGLGDWIVRRPERWLFAGTRMTQNLLARMIQR